MKNLKKSLNLKKTLNGIEDYFSPKVVGEVNDVYVKLAKIKGDKVPWHTHENEDELFYVIKGELFFEIEKEPSFTMKKDDLFVVPRGVKHRVSAVKECHIILIENKKTLHTGKVKSEITKDIEQQKY